MVTQRLDGGQLHPRVSGWLPDHLRTSVLNVPRRQHYLCKEGIEAVNEKIDWFQVVIVTWWICTLCPVKSFVYWTYLSSSFHILAVYYLQHSCVADGGNK